MTGERKWVPPLKPILQPFAPVEIKRNNMTEGWIKEYNLTKHLIEKYGTKEEKIPRKRREQIEEFPGSLEFIFKNRQRIKTTKHSESNGIFNVKQIAQIAIFLGIGKQGGGKRKLVPLINEHLDRHLSEASEQF